MNLPSCWASEKQAKHRKPAVEIQTTNSMLTFILAARTRNVFLLLELSHSLIYIRLYLWFRPHEYLVLRAAQWNQHNTIPVNGFLS